jgi:calcium-dependent protein kinase
MLTFESNKRISALECLRHNWFIKNKNKGISDKKTAKNIINNMKKFKRGKKLEQASISFIVNQLISKDERKELIKQFQDWDTNGDGVLSRDEIIEGYRKTYGAVDENEIDNIMKSIDLDGNGVIDYNEFLSCAFNRDKIMSKDNLELTFKAFDSDGSGKISVDELMTIFTKGDKGHANREVFEKMVKEADENGDGEISFQEFKTIMAKFFS